MIDYSPTLVKELKKILPTFYENKLTSDTPTPCISYMELNNSAVNTGDTIGYSRLTFQVKVWAYDIKTINQYVSLVDDTMRTLGFKRISSGEMRDNQSTMIQRILTYEALALEEY